MNIELARTFLEVVSCGSFAKAADRLNVTHSTVTMRIKTLEDVLRKRVLIRNKSGVSMTAAGIRFQRFAKSLVRTWQLTRRQMSLATGFEGVLSIGAESNLWNDMMFDWVCNTRREQPHIAIRCESGNADHLLNRLFQGWLDCCIVYTAQSRSGFTVERLFEDPLVLIDTEDRALLDRWDPEFIEIDWDEGYRAQVEQYWNVDEDTPHISVITQDLGIRFTEVFGGSTWIPKRLFEQKKFKREFFRVRGAPVFERTAYLIYSPEALKERLPKLGIAQLRKSLLKQAGGAETIWVDEAGAGKAAQQK